ncbi:MAG: AraC family transcriptional regulator [Candidatus Cyclobacteriaceae bacterium M3_2C_046]
MNYLKYLTLAEEDHKLGLNILHTGKNLIQPNQEYPFPEHPVHYQFQWNNGRILDEYQINFIVNGQGIFESASAGKQSIQSGSIVFLFPNEWHRYKPDPNTGWNEYWIGFKGIYADHLLKNQIIDHKIPVVYVSHNEKIFRLYQEMIETAKAEPPGYQIIMAGILIQIIGMANRLYKEKDFEGKNTETLLQQSRLLLMENPSQPVSPQQVAKKLNIGYSWFRKMFKKYTGLAPGQYQMQQRIYKAKEMLMNRKKTIKEIAMDLGFESNFHFSKTFKSKTGYSPGKYRKKIMGNH